MKIANASARFGAQLKLHMPSGNINQADAGTFRGVAEVLDRRDDFMAQAKAMPDAADPMTITLRPYGSSEHYVNDAVPAATVHTQHNGAFFMTAPRGLSLLQFLGTVFDRATQKAATLKTPDQQVSGLLNGVEPLIRKLDAQLEPFAFLDEPLAHLPEAAAFRPQQLWKAVAPSLSSAPEWLPSGHVENVSLALRNPDQADAPALQLRWVRNTQKGGADYLNRLHWSTLDPMDGKPHAEQTDHDWAAKTKDAGLRHRLTDAQGRLDTIVRRLDATIPSNLFKRPLAPTVSTLRELLAEHRAMLNGSANGVWPAKHTNAGSQHPAEPSVAASMS